MEACAAGGKPIARASIAEVKRSEVFSVKASASQNLRAWNPWAAKLGDWAHTGMRPRACVGCGGVALVLPELLPDLGHNFWAVCC